MKFTNGYWEMRPGHAPFYAAQPHEIEISSNALTVHAAAKRLTGRGDTLNLPVITVQFSAPIEDVIRVRVVHHKGIRNPGPAFQLRDIDSPQPVVTDEEKFAALTSGALSVRIHKGDSWRVEYQAGGRALTSSGWRSLGFVDTPQGRFMHEQLSLGVGECVYGLGERFTPFVKNGQTVDIWNEDGGTSSELAYKNIPFYLTNRNYGVFVNHPEKVSFEVASEKVERVQFSVPGEVLEYFVIYGATPKDVLERYTALTGRPALPPAWSFGLWLSTSFTTNYDEPTVTGFIREMKARSIPLHVFHFDCFWMKEFRWCDFTWDERCFPDPEGMLRRLKEHGVRICVWINPYIAQRSALFDEAAESGYLLKKTDGGVWQSDSWQAGMGIVDFTNPAACAWFQSKLRALLEIGVDAFKTDFGERIPTEGVAWFDGSDPLKMHNYYSYLYNKTVFDLLKETRGEGEAVVFARSATAGGQQFPVHWGGDCTSTFESMDETLRGGLSLALSGFGFWSHDIGGFEAAPLSLGEKNRGREAQVYKRWVAFGLLSSHSRLHGGTSYRVPWVYDEEAVDVLAKFTRLKCQLMPYLYRAALQAHQRGTPMLRAMMMEFPDDPACDTLDRQYMLGDSLLVAPIFSADNTVNYYVPAGRWTNLLNRNVVEGPRWTRETHDFFSLPLLARPNSVIPLGFDDEHPDYDYSQGVTLRIYELEDDQQVQVEIPNTQGEIETRFEVRREAGTITITPQNASKPWKALLVNVREAKSITHLEETPEGILVLPAEPSSIVNIKVMLT